MIEQDRTTEKRGRSDRILHRLGIPLRRLDGKPELTNGTSVSVAHAADLTLVVTGEENLACDLELIMPRSPELWCDLLGVSPFALATAVSQENQESLDMVATRLWTTLECLKKAGSMLDVPLLLHEITADGWVWFVSGEQRIGTFVCAVRGVEQRLVVAVLMQQSPKKQLSLTD
jgi:enediyne polyketide synthase